jgi:hypothetical protein
MALDALAADRLTRLQTRLAAHGMVRGAAEDLVVRVPVGTIVRDEKTGVLLGDLSAEGQLLRVANGGKGGRGNWELKTEKNTVPGFAELGEKGQGRWLDLQLKLLADVGVVGVPNAGKSSFLAAVTNAKPKIADYPFTTVVPNLGVCGTCHVDERGRAPPKPRARTRPAALPSCQPAPAHEAASSWLRAKPAACLRTLAQATLRCGRLLPAARCLLARLVADGLLRRPGVRHAACGSAARARAALSRARRHSRAAGGSARRGGAGAGLLEAHRAVPRAPPHRRRLLPRPALRLQGHPERARDVLARPRPEASGGMRE